MRVIITGSRHWLNRRAIQAEIEKLPSGCTIIHGGASGADAYADQIAGWMGLPVESYPADWEKHGKAAGPIRNSLMLSKGADLVLAFPLSDSIGTWDIVNKAREAGVEVRIFEPEASSDTT